MQTTKPEVMSASGKVKLNSTTPNSDLLFIDSNAPKKSIEYARARVAINADFACNMTHNAALAKRIRRESKERTVSFLGGKVSKKMLDERDAQGNQRWKMIVTFKDGSVANL